MRPNLIAKSEEWDFDKSDKQGCISLSERKGRRKDQQDAGFIGILPNIRGSQDAKNFLQEAIVASESKHKSCFHGTTVCSAIVSGEDIAVANLGDSRAALIFRYKGVLRDRYISVLLTQDHDLDVPRVRNYVENNGGTISFDRGVEVVNQILEMGGAIGDNIVLNESKNKKDCLIRNPDIFHYNISDLCEKIGIKQDKIIDLDLVVSCDGLWNFNKKIDPNFSKMKCNFKAYVDENGEQKLRKNLTASFRDNLFDIKKSHLINKERSFADIACEHALKKGSRDNVSVAHIAIKSNQNQLIAANQTIIATICDGHGVGDKYSKEEDIDEGVKEYWDGLVVSSSVAADIFVAGQVEQIPGLEINSEKQNDLYKLIAARSIKSKSVESVVLDMGIDISPNTSPRNPHLSNLTASKQMMMR
jgi:serine/threonine protein phosphatase PrpC